MSKGRESLNVLLLSGVGTRINPYLGLLRAGLTAAGAEVHLAERLSRDLLAPPSRPDVIHLHWLDRYDLPPPIAFPRLHGARDLPRRALRRLLETICNSPVVYQGRRWQRLRRLLVQLRLFRAAGGCVVYTVHNLGAHEGEGIADRRAAAILMRLADIIHVHDESTAQAVAARFGRRHGITVIPHGHYLTSYPNHVGRAEARSSLGLPADALVYVTLGLLRPYKGLEELVRAFRALPNPNAALLLAGMPSPPTYADHLIQMAGGDPRVRLTRRFIAPDEVQLYLNSADICVLPYREVTTSGAAFLAFSFGLPVIAPAIGAFPELIADQRGFLYDPTDPDGLAQALRRAAAGAQTGVREDIRNWVAQFDWTGIGEQMVAAYRSGLASTAGGDKAP